MPGGLRPPGPVVAVAVRLWCEGSAGCGEACAGHGSARHVNTQPQPVAVHGASHGDPATHAHARSTVHVCVCPLAPNARMRARSHARTQHSLRGHTNGGTRPQSWRRHATLTHCPTIPWVKVCPVRLTPALAGVLIILCHGVAVWSLRASHTSACVAPLSPGGKTALQRDTRVGAQATHEGMPRRSPQCPALPRMLRV